MVVLRSGWYFTVIVVVSTHAPDKITNDTSGSFYHKRNARRLYFQINFDQTGLFVVIKAYDKAKSSVQEETMITYP